MPTLDCHHCGAHVQIDEPLARDAECPTCKRDLRCCINCRHYDTTRNNQCRETQAELVEDKARRNFCEYFSYRQDPWTLPAKGQVAQAREGLERMFKDPPGTPQKRAPSARDSLDSLFGGSAPPSDRAEEARRKLERLFEKPEDESGAT
jgi:hypothetical protein